jgi:signal transduction histidine kinase
MREKRRRFILVITGIVMGLAAVIAQMVCQGSTENNIITRRFCRILHEKEKIMEDCLNDLRIIMAKGESHGSVSENRIFGLASQNGITILQYIDRRLVYWSDNSFDVPVLLQDESLFSRPLIFMQNGWFLPAYYAEGNERVIGLLRVRTDYSFENDIIKSGFTRDFGLPPDVGFSAEKSENGNDIFNSRGEFLFSLVFPATGITTSHILIPLILWCVFFLLILALLLGSVRSLAASGKNLTGIIVTILFFSMLYFIVLFARQPSVIFRTSLFSPYVFSLNGFIPSLGHFMIFSILAGLFGYVFYNYVNFSNIYQKKTVGGRLLPGILLVAGTLLISMFHVIFRRLILNSNINFETYKVLDLSIFSAVGFISVLFLLVLPVSFICKAFQTGSKPDRFVIIPALVVSAAVIIAFTWPGGGSMPALLFLWAGIIAVVWIRQFRKPGKLSIPLFFSLTAGIYSLMVITAFSEEKANEILKVHALSLSTENDPEAEHLLLDMWPVLQNDAVLADMMDVEFFETRDFNIISAYLHNNYFNGYWGNFNVSIYLCRQGQLIRIGPGDHDFEDCYAFFEERIDKYGHPLTGTQFCFIDNQGARPYYIGRLFFETGSNVTNGLFIELYGDINVFQPGYSELLLDKRFHGYSGLKNYSFAKYLNGEIILSHGDFPYNKADEEYVDETSDYRVFDNEGFKHILYCNGNATVMISRPLLNAGKIIISFAYLFAFIFIVVNSILLFFAQSSPAGFRGLDFRQKLQISFTGILLFSFILVGIAVATFTIKEFQSNHYNNIKEKLNSIYTELEAEISMERHLTPNWRNSNNASLNELLINLSNIFNTDVNLYDLNGYLMATSRPELFFRDLTSHRMNMKAFMNVSDLTKSEYIQTESVGNMKYISAYVPFYNVEKHVLAYLNLPYFRMQSLLTREISDMIVAIVNFTLLIIVITMAFVVFISGRLTSPLSMLGEGLASVRLGRKSEHLSYRGRDEIGDLVSQYNRMVDELEESAHKLANSEREYAWREMAKQIAHEIKNPLTPMKLNVQQLQKSWNDKIHDFGDKLEVFARNQIEYINNLSNIATAFSSFAKMPGANPVELDLLDQIGTTLELFRNTGNTSFKVNWPSGKRVIIHADREQLNGIFSNLFKNSIQAIPPEREGLIEVGMEAGENRVTVSVSDNGCGIPEAIRKKMFTPNFTTKSSGTGLGLSIVKRYVEGAGGSVWFESEPGKGTTFFVEFPLVPTVEKPEKPFKTLR